jgi:hypothetical protein
MMLMSNMLQAFATPDALGVIAVAGVPELAKLRADLLPLATQLANLPKETLLRLTHPESKYSVGWSCGQERPREGEQDTLKGSFYANPLVDVPEDETSATEPQGVLLQRASPLWQGYQAGLNTCSKLECCHMTGKHSEELQMMHTRWQQSGFASFCNVQGHPTQRASILAPQLAAHSGAAPQGV